MASKIVRKGVIITLPMVIEGDDYRKNVQNKVAIRIDYTKRGAERLWFRLAVLTTSNPSLQNGLQHCRTGFLWFVQVGLGYIEKKGSL